MDSDQALAAQPAWKIVAENSPIIKRNTNGFWQLSRLGSVNLEALQELVELQARANDLQAQFADLASAKRSLEEVIERINADG